jgi:hypothetical protein
MNATTSAMAASTMTQRSPPAVMVPVVGLRVPAQLREDLVEVLTGWLT